MTKSTKIPIPEDSFELEKFRSRFSSYFEKSSNCWEWKGMRNDRGYPMFSIHAQKYRSHRISYMLFKGDIPDGLTIDHLCRNRLCCNPEHLEAITNKENILRGMGTSAFNAVKIHCPLGHEYTLENTYITTKGSRECRTCKSLKHKQFHKNNPLKMKEYNHRKYMKSKLNKELT